MMKVRQRCSRLTLLSMALSFPVVWSSAWAEQESSYSTLLAPLRHGALEVWVPDTFFMGLMNDPTARIVNNYDWTRLQKEFDSDFPAFRLHFKVIGRGEFEKTILSSKDHPPDMAFLDNASQLNPFGRDGSIILPLPSGPSRFGQNGWWTIFRKAKNPEAAKAFALWLVRSPHWTPPTLRTGLLKPADAAPVKGVSKEIVVRLLTKDSRGPSSMMDSDAISFDWQYPPLKLSSVDSLLVFGKSRLAFEVVEVVGEGNGGFGMAHCLVVLRKAVADRKVLMFRTGSLPEIEALLRSFDEIGLVEVGPDNLGKVTLLGPIDHAKVTRWPKSQIEWANTGGQTAAYVVESQFGQSFGDIWSESRILLLPPQPGQKSIRIDTPFGVGVQPHRWRVWAISKAGIISISEWRTIDFTN